MGVEKRKRDWALRQTVGMLAYWFPSWRPSGFDLEAPLILEDARGRLAKLSQVRATRAAPIAQMVLVSFLSGLRGNIFHHERTSVSVAPIQLNMDKWDDDTYRYHVNLENDGFNITVQGYLKRWEADSTLVTGKIYFDMHYLGLLFKSLFITLIAGSGLGLFLFFAQFFRVFVSAWELGSRILNQIMLMPGILFLLWLVVFATLWINDVVFPAQIRRNQLVTRIEDMLLLAHQPQERSSGDITESSRTEEQANRQRRNN